MPFCCLGGIFSSHREALQTALSQEEGEGEGEREKEEELVFLQ